MTAKKKQSIENKKVLPKKAAAPPPRKKPTNEDTPFFSVMGIKYKFPKGTSEGHQFKMFIAALMFILIVLWVAHHLSMTALVINTVRNTKWSNLWKLSLGRSP
jgi:hypothetical protein